LNDPTPTRAVDQTIATNLLKQVAKRARASAQRTAAVLDDLYATQPTPDQLPSSTLIALKVLQDRLNRYLTTHLPPEHEGE